MTLEDGERLDSRQPVEGDPWSRVARRTMVSSFLWWMTTSSLVEAILDSAGPDAFALVDGPPVLAELRPDGKVRRRQLRSALTGGVSKLEIGVSGPKGRLNRKYQPLVENAPLPGYRIGINFVPGTRWQLLEGATGLLRHVLPGIAPAVIVSTDPVPFGMSYASFEATYLRGGATLVLPHSDGEERHIRSVLDWVRNGRPPREEERPEETEDWWRDERDEDSWAPIREASIPMAADFAVTGLYRDGDWRDPANLEAARKFVQTRFDLRIGIWDLAENPALRTSLLKPTPIRPAPVEPASVPKGSTRRASEYEAAQWEDEETHDAFSQSIDRLAKALQPLGWTSPTRRGWTNPVRQDGVVEVVIGSTPDLLLPLTEPVRLEGEATPLAWLELTINKRTTRVSVKVARYKVVRPYLDSRREVLSEIAKPGKCDLRSGRPVLWEARGGWGDEVDWPSRIAELGERTPTWLQALADLPRVLLSEHMESPITTPRRSTH